MAKWFFLGIISIGCLMARASCGRLDAENNRIELSESPRIIDYSFLSCVLLKRVSACSETCFLVGSIYGQPINYGVCNERNECTCAISPTASLEDYWYKRFDSDSRNVLGEILKDGALSKKVLAVLKTPFQTYQETVSALKPLLKEKQVENLHPWDKVAQNIFVADDKFEAVQEYVEKKVRPYVSIDGVEIKKQLSKVIEKSDGAFFDRIYQEVCRSRNELLIEALNEYNKSRSIGTSTCYLKEDESNLIRLLDVETVNKLMNILPSKPSKQSDPSSSPSKPSGRSDPSSSPSKPSKQSDLSSSPSKPSKQSDPSTKEKKSKSTARSSNAKDVWWKLRGFKKSEVEKFKEGEKEWDIEGYYDVYLVKNSSGLSLEWYNKKHGVDIAMNHIYNGEITQQWDFQNANIELNKNVDGTRTQKWVFKNFTYEVTLDLAGKILHSQTEGKENSSLFKNYKQRINTWCAENDYIVGKDNCIIY